METRQGWGSSAVRRVQAGVLEMVLEAGAVTHWSRAQGVSVPVPEGSVYLSVRIDGGLQRHCCGVCDLAAFISPLP